MHVVVIVLHVVTPDPVCVQHVRLTHVSNPDVLVVQSPSDPVSWQALTSSVVQVVFVTPVAQLRLPVVVTGEHVVVIVVHVVTPPASVLQTRVMQVSTPVVAVVQFGAPFASAEP